MIANLLICALTVFSPVQGDEGYEYSHETYSADKVIDQKFWNQKKSLRVGYEFHDFQNSIGMMTPDKFSFGLSSIHSIWFHKKPIGNVLKIGFDHGLDLNYSRFEDPGHDNGYNAEAYYQYMNDVILYLCSIGNKAEANRFLNHYVYWFDVKIDNDSYYSTEKPQFLCDVARGKLQRIINTY